MAGPVSYFLEDWMKRSFVSCKYYNTEELLNKTAQIVTKVLNLQICTYFFWIRFSPLGHFPFSEVCEKRGQDFPAFLRQNPTYQSRTIREILHEQIHHAAAGAHGLIPGAVPHPLHPGIQNRSGTHGAGFQRHIELTFIQPPCPQRFIGLGNGLHLRMGGRRLLLLPPVPPSAHDPAVTDNDAPDRDLSGIRRFPGQRQRFFHKILLHLTDPFFGLDTSAKPSNAGSAGKGGAAERPNLPQRQGLGMRSLRRRRIKPGIFVQTYHKCMVGGTST